MSISFFLIIYSYREIFGKMPMLKEIGKYSFPMYLFHFFIYNTLVLILPHTFLYSSIILILTISLSYIISWIIMKYVRPYIFPNSFTELKNTWLKKQQDYGKMQNESVHLPLPREIKFSILQRGQEFYQQYQGII